MSAGRRSAGPPSARPTDPDSRHPRSLAWNRLVDWGIFGDDVVIFHPLSKQYFVLGGLAKAIWTLADGSHTAEALSDELSRDRALSSEAIRETITGLAEFGLFES